MIEIEADILRGTCTPVFFVGETVECEIKFRCVAANKDKFVGGKQQRQELEQQQQEMKEKDRYLSLDTGTVVDSAKMNEISESMFSILSSAAYQQQMSQVSSPTSSVPSTPGSFFYKTTNNQSKSSFQSFVHDDRTSSSSAKSSDTQTNVDDCDLDYDPNYVIAWACAQIDCNCYIDETKVILPKDPLRYGNVNSGGNPAENANGKSNEASNTSFQPNKDRVGISVYSSKPKILFCNLFLKPNDARSFFFKETLPYDLAPTFRGQYAKYSYKITIGVQKLNKHTQLLRLPFRVYSLLDFEKYIPKQQLSFDNDYECYNNNSRSESIISITDSVNNNSTAAGDNTVFSFDTVTLAAKENFNISSIKNPFKIEQKSDYENLEYALQILEDNTARMNVSSFNVTNADGKIAKITLNKINYKIGDKLVVYLDFSESQVQTLEFKVTLQSEEIISEECRKKSNQTPSSIHSHAEIKEYSFYMKKTDVTMQIPVHVTPAFVSDIVSLRWRLHFEFALSKMNIYKIQRSSDAAMSVSWRPPSSLPIDVISWDLPIVIYPFDPFVASDLIYSNRAVENTLILK